MSSSTIANHRLASRRFLGWMGRSGSLIHGDSVDFPFIGQSVGNPGPTAAKCSTDKTISRPGRQDQVRAWDCPLGLFDDPVAEAENRVIA
jgi:hypothetical protein